MLLLAAAIAWSGGCDGDGYALRLHLYLDDAGGLGQGSAVVVQVKDLQAPGDGKRVGVLVDQDVSADEPLDVDVTLDGGGQYHAHIVATTPGGRFVATRCYDVGGVHDSEILLVGPLAEDQDLDRDSWPAEESCRERGSSEVGCADQCPAVRAVDCNEAESDINPGAPEICDDHIDQDCNTADATCDSEDQ